MKYPTRRVRPLAETTNKRLFSYALAAGAGMLAAAQPADAGVIYNNPPDITLMNAGAAIDLDGDGIADVNFGMSLRSAAGYYRRSLMVDVPNGAVKGGTVQGHPYANKAVPSYFVSARKQFVQDPATMAFASRHRTSLGSWVVGVGGWWANYTNGYLGVQFLHQSNPVYGWVRMDVMIPPGTTDIGYTIKDWAYEDSGGPIHVGMIPEPGTLGLLALGSVALVAWRRRKKEQA